MLSYLAAVRPFDNLIENALHIFNELAVIAAILHLFPFSDAYDMGKDIRDVAGWSFIVAVVLQVLTNLILKGYLVAQLIGPFIKKLKKKISKLMAKKEAID